MILGGSVWAKSAACVMAATFYFIGYSIGLLTALI